MCGSFCNPAERGEGPGVAAPLACPSRGPCPRQAEADAPGGLGERRRRGRAADLAELALGEPAIALASTRVASVPRLAVTSEALANR
jgi:hypothetical protein